MSTGPSDILTGARTMWELVDRRAAASPDHPMLIAADGTTVTFGEFRDRAERVAAGLHGMGISTGSVVSWQLPTRIDTIVLSIALARLGAVQNPIIHLYREREVGFALRQTGASLFVILGTWRDIDFAAIADRALADAPARPTVFTVDAGLPEADPGVLPPPPPGAAPEDAPIRWIYYTSGSTADPKGVQHTDQTLIAGGWGLARALDMGPDDVGSIAFPFAHIAGPDYLVTMLSFGFPAVLVEAFSAPVVLPVFRKHGATMVGGSTAFYVAYLAEQRKAPGDPVLPSLRLMSGGGAAKPPEVHYEVRDEIGGRGVVHGYGMTEVPMISNGSPHDTDEQLANTDGKPVEGADVRVVRLDGAPAKPGEEGEVRVKGPMVFHGYTDPALTKEAFDEEGYFRTGDLGKLRADGHLTLTGRLKDVIVRKGENISAKEIEDLLYTHPKVVEVAVIGLPDRERGERVCAVVQLAEGAETLGLTEVVAFCRDAGLMTQKIPEQLEVRTDWPRAGTGKVVKKSLRDEYAPA
ncbi:MAG TPA: AMP-binding protein [Acidimicrobiales bacterium]|jgi:acyl-CoA synthetase (AMP-forming)/AMP-acid ligase II|nr:AMP-binding protein [Acidimicrobiales bacterium]